jgi:hypothetical protein
MSEKPSSKAPALSGQNGTIAKAAIAGVAGIALGFIIGHFAIAPATGNVNKIGNTTTDQNNFNQVVCTYTTPKGTKTITMGDAIKYQSGGTTNAEGKYTVPSAESILALARNQILEETAKEAGITVTDDEINEYAKKTYSVNSIQEMAQTFGYEENQLKEMIKNAIVMEKLQEQKSGEISQPPAYPETPADQNAVTKENADAIIKYAGDNWKNGAWANPDGDWAKAMKDQNFSADGADYAAVLAAYQVAYQEYSEKYSEQQAAWTDYVNTIYKDSTIALGTMMQ